MWIPFQFAVCFYFSLGVCGVMAISSEKDLHPLIPQDQYSSVYVTNGTRMLRDQALFVRTVRTFMFFQPVLERTIWHCETMKYIKQTLHKTSLLLGIPKQRWKCLSLKISCCLHTDVWLQMFSGKLHPFLLPTYAMLGCSFIWATLNLFCSSGWQKSLGQPIAQVPHKYAVWVKTPWCDAWK